MMNIRLLQKLKEFKKLMLIYVPVVAILILINFLRVNNLHKELKFKFVDNVYRNSINMLEIDDSNDIRWNLIPLDIAHILEGMESKYSKYSEQLKEKNFKNIRNEDKELFLTKYKKVWFKESTKNPLSDNKPLGERYRGVKISFIDFLEDLVNLKEVNINENIK
ncbi:MAG: hypothetical protein ACRC41_18505 [Sarcina sp.]